MARTAAVVGTATATRNAVNRHSAQKDAAAYSEAMAATQPAQPAEPQVVYVQAPPQEAPPAAPAAAPQSDLVAQINQLSQLHNAGVLSDAEFEAAKAKLLGTG
jgi:hypothetical protein